VDWIKIGPDHFCSRFICKWSICLPVLYESAAGRNDHKSQALVIDSRTFIVMIYRSCVVLLYALLRCHYFNTSNRESRFPSIRWIAAGFASTDIPDIGPRGAYDDFVTCISDLWKGFRFVNRFIRCSQVVTTINYNTLKVTVTHKIKFSASACLVTRWILKSL
jgi:hypothetical protein